MCGRIISKSSSRDIVEVVQEQTEMPDDAPFVWKSNWYPVFPVIDADKTIPHAFQVTIYFKLCNIIVIMYLRS